MSLVLLGNCLKLRLEMWEEKERDECVERGGERLVGRREFDESNAGEDLQEFIQHLHVGHQPPGISSAALSFA